MPTIADNGTAPDSEAVSAIPSTWTTDLRNTRTPPIALTRIGHWLFNGVCSATAAGAGSPCETLRLALPEILRGAHVPSLYLLHARKAGMRLGPAMQSAFGHIAPRCGPKPREFSPAVCFHGRLRRGTSTRRMQCSGEAMPSVKRNWRRVSGLSSLRRSRRRVSARTRNEGAFPTVHGERSGFEQAALPSADSRAKQSLE